MKLLKLSANQDSFKTIRFNESGLSLIVGKRKDPESKQLKKTYNGVGKSLVVRLVHFCLGSNPIEVFAEKLPEWEFYLDFLVAGQHYRSARATENQKVITLNDEELSLDEFKERIQSLAFQIDRSIKGLKFRPLISRFARPSKRSYGSFDQYIPEETPYVSLLCTGFLLGLDANKIEKKKDLKDELDRVDTTRKRLERDQTLKDYFTGTEDLNAEILDYEEKIEQLKSKAAKFRIAEDYYERQQRSDALTQQLKRLSNKATVQRNALRSIEKSLEVRSDLAPEKVIEMYTEANFHFGDSLKRRLHDVDLFHKEITTRRGERLIKEKGRVESRLSELENRAREVRKDLDQIMSYLGRHGALDQFAEISQQLATAKAQHEKLTSYRDLIADLKRRTTELKEEFARANSATQRYLEQAAHTLDRNRKLFRSFSREFYENKPGTIEVENNDRVNQVRFDIAAKIQDDASDGINEVKIFCFDFTLLVARHSHRVDFVFHDSRLFSDMDPRQRATLFKVARRVTSAQGLQYIANINEDMLESMREFLDDEEFEAVQAATVLELTDESPSTKLLGVQVDMNYDA